MIQNLAWATVYSAIVILLAAGVTVRLGFVLSPAIGAVLISFSTIVAAINAQFLRKLDLGYNISMKKLFTGIITVFTILLLNTFGLAFHASAMPMTSHEMGSMNHEASSSASCATLCRTAVMAKDEILNLELDEENDEPTIPFYAQNEVWKFSKIHVNQKIYADWVKPPPKVPIYIMNGVFRV